jgi:sodium transport system permease protein
LTWRPALTVMRKELRDSIRDWRSLVSALLYAVWGPAVMAMALMALARSRAPEQPITLAIDGQTQHPALVAFLAERSVTIIEGQARPADRIRMRQLEVALAVDEDFAADFSRFEPARVTLLFDGSWSESNAKAERVRNLLSEYADRVADTRLLLRGVSPAIASPIRVIENDLSTPAGRAATVLATLPIFLLLSAFVGGMGVASDLTAGERERGSLESLLLHPIPRGALVVGKWAAVSLISLATVTLTLWTSRVVLAHPRVQALDVPVGLLAIEAAEMWLVLAPLALLVASVQLLIALFSKTYKEAQTQLSMFIFLPMIPGFLFAFGSVEGRPWMSWLPMLGQHMAISDLLRGHPASAVAMASLTVVTLTALVLTLTLTTRLLDRESIVQRTGA